MNVTFETVKNNHEINTYIRQADASMIALGFTEHSFAHVGKCASVASKLLSDLDYPAREVELAKIAGYMHDIGNVINRIDHAQSGAVMAFRILDKLGMPPEDVATVITAIGNHDEHTAHPVNAVAAALIIADKSDVRRSRVRADNMENIKGDIHDRVNYAVENAELTLDKEAGAITLSMNIDQRMCSVMDYFEIFTTRMLLCRKAAAFLGLKFKLVIDDAVIM
ncbi:MAG: HD domain-containing protein [Clostridiales bacterium]|nr:HD domain-containing protein [Clostridiales bacterium]